MQAGDLETVLRGGDKEANASRPLLKTPSSRVPTSAKPYMISLPWLSTHILLNWSLSPITTMKPSDFEYVNTLSPRITVPRSLNALLKHSITRSVAIRYPEHSIDCLRTGYLPSIRSELSAFLSPKANPLLIHPTVCRVGNWNVFNSDKATIFSPGAVLSEPAFARTFVIRKVLLRTSAGISIAADLNNNTFGAKS